MSKPRKSLVLSAVVALLTVLGVGLVAGPAQAAKTVDWTSTTMRLPWTAAKLAPRGPICPGGVVHFKSGPYKQYGIVVRHGITTTIQPLGQADVNRDGRMDTLVKFTCGPSAGGNAMHSPVMDWFYVYTTRGGHPILEGYLTSGQNEASPLWFVTTTKMRRGAIDVTHYVEPPGHHYFTVTRTYRYVPQLHRFLPNRPLPFYPQADRRP